MPSLCDDEAEVLGRAPYRRLGTRFTPGPDLTPRGHQLDPGWHARLRQPAVREGPAKGRRADVRNVAQPVAGGSASGQQVPDVLTMAQVSIRRAVTKERALIEGPYQGRRAFASRPDKACARAW